MNLKRLQTLASRDVFLFQRIQPCTRKLDICLVNELSHFLSVSIQEGENVTVVNKLFPSRWHHKPNRLTMFFFNRALPYNKKGIRGIYAQVSRQASWVVGSSKHC